MVKRRAVKQTSGVKPAYYMVSVVWDEATLHSFSSLTEVAAAIRDLVAVNGIHNVQLFVIARGYKVKVLVSGDPLSPVVKLIDGDKEANTLSVTDKFTESTDGFLFQRDSSKSSVPEEEPTSDGFGFFDFSG